MIKKIIYVTEENRYARAQVYTIVSFTAIINDGIVEATGNGRYFCENPKYSAYWRKTYFPTKRTAIQAMKGRYKKIRKLSKNEINGKMKNLTDFNDWHGPREIYVM